jgi:hypothetical protein
MTDTPPETEMSKPAEILYRAFSDELRFAKQQQWTITNYSLLLMAAVFGVARLSPPPTLEKIVLCVIVAIIWIAGLFVLLDLQGYMHILRRRQRGMEDAFTPEDRRLARGEDSLRIRGDERLGERLALRVYLMSWSRAETPRAETPRAGTTRNPTTGVLCVVLTIAAFSRLGRFCICRCGCFGEVRGEFCGSRPSRTWRCRPHGLEASSYHLTIIPLTI